MGQSYLRAIMWKLEQRNVMWNVPQYCFEITPQNTLVGMII